MAEWDIQMENAIAQYKLIFADERNNQKILCELDKNLFVCHGIDKIELCVYCITMQENFLDKLKWEFQKKDNEYYFIPSAGADFEKSIEEIKRKYSECKKKNNYCKNKYLTSVYETCGSKEMDSYFKSCNTVIDMIFNMNRKERSKKELDKFNALFCCTRLFIFRRFLLDATQYMKNLDAEEKIAFLDEVTSFLDKVLSIRKCIDGENKENEVLKDLEESASITISLLRKNKYSQAISSSFTSEFAAKVKQVFAVPQAWDYNKKMRKMSCRDIFRNMVRIPFPQIVFPNENDIETVRNMVSSRSKSA